MSNRFTLPVPLQPPPPSVPRVSASANLLRDQLVRSFLCRRPTTLDSPQARHGNARPLTAPHHPTLPPRVKCHERPRPRSCRCRNRGQPLRGVPTARCDEVTESPRVSGRARARRRCRPGRRLRFQTSARRGEGRACSIVSWRPPTRFRKRPGRHSGRCGIP